MFIFQKRIRKFEVAFIATENVRRRYEISSSVLAYFITAPYVVPSVLMVMLFLFTADLYHKKVDLA